MNELITNVAYTYMQIGVTGLIVVALVVGGVWWISRGRKPAMELQRQMIEVLAKNGTIIDRLGAVIEDNTLERRELTQHVKSVGHRVDKVSDQIENVSDQLDEIQREQAVCMDRQKRSK